MHDDARSLSRQLAYMLTDTRKRTLELVSDLNDEQMRGPIIGLSWEDVGSGVVALFATVLVLGLVTERREAAVRVVGAASIAGVIAMLVDLFV